MSSTPMGTGRGRYIVRSEGPGQLAEFLDTVREEPDLEVVDLIGPADKPHTAVIVTTGEKATSLAQRFGDTHGLKIEPDRPLSLF